jgi:hypothetical protein
MARGGGLESSDGFCAKGRCADVNTSTHYLWDFAIHFAAKGCARRLTGNQNTTVFKYLLKGHSGCTTKIDSQSPVYQNTSLAYYSSAPGSHRPLTFTRARRQEQTFVELAYSDIHPPSYYSKLLIPAFWPIGNTKSAQALLGELAIPQADDLDILRCLGSQVCVGGLDWLKHSGDLTSGGVHLQQVSTGLRGVITDSVMHAWRTRYHTPQSPTSDMMLALTTNVPASASVGTLIRNLGTEDYCDWFSSDDWSSTHRALKEVVVWHKKMSRHNPHNGLIGVKK